MQPAVGALVRARRTLSCCVLDHGAENDSGQKHSAGAGHDAGMPRLNSLNSNSVWPHSCWSVKAPLALTKLPISSSFLMSEFERMLYPTRGWPHTIGSRDRTATHCE